MMAIQQFIEISSVSIGNACSLRHLTVGRMEKLDEILLFELATGFR